MDTPWSRARKLRSQRQEENLSKLPGGRKGVNSGRFWRWPRDGRIYDFLVEARTNEKPGAKSYSIKKAEFEDIRFEALTSPGGMKPAMQITMDDLHLIVIELKDFTGILTRLMELERDRPQ